MHRLRLYRYQAYSRVLFWMALIGSYTLAVMPSSIAPHFSWSDKANHIFAFVVLTLLLRLGYRLSYFVSFALMVAYGGFIEISQYFLPTRSSELADIAADTIGIFAGLKIYKLLRKI